MPENQTKLVCSAVSTNTFVKEKPTILNQNIEEIYL